MEAVEILEGPQGTLYGAGALGGILVLRPNMPQPGHWSGEAAAGLSVTQHGRPGCDFSATLNAPLGSIAAIRLTGYGADEGGYIDNPLTGKRDVNHVVTSGGRFNASTELRADWTADILLTAQQIRGDDSQYSDQGGNDLDRSSPLALPFSSDFGLASLVVRKDRGPIRFRSTTGFLRQEVNERFDVSDALAARALDQHSRGHGISSETRIWRPMRKGLSWLAGISLLDHRYVVRRSRTEREQHTRLGGVTNRITEATLYGEAGIELLPSVEVTAGARWTRTDLSGEGQHLSLLAFDRLSALDPDRKERRLLPSASIVARPLDGLTLYARYQQGFRPGGLSIANDNVQLYRHDLLATGEAGFRIGKPLIDRFDLAGSISRSRWRHIQADYLDGAGLPVTANIGKGRIWSATLNGGVLLLPGLRLEGDLAYASNSVSIGPVANTGTGFGLIIDGNVTGDGVYTGVNGNAIQIGGLGGTVSIANGLGISGLVTARSLDRTATAITLGAGASTPELRNSGRVVAVSGKGGQAQAIAVSVAANASLPVLRNSGEISASVGSEDAGATAIIDRSGSLALIENSGAIVARGAAAASVRNVAIDLSANLTGATVRQTAVAASVAAPSIIGDIRFASGNDLLDVADGVHTGNLAFGAGANRYALSGDALATGNLGFGSGNDTVTLAGTSVLSGNIDFGGGVDVLTLAGKTAFTGQLLNASGLAVSVSQGTLTVRKAATIGSLTMADGGVLGVFLDKTAGASTAITITGAASFGTGSKLQSSVSDIANAEGTYNVLTAGTLAGASNLAANSDLLPFIYKGTLTTSANALSVSVSRKTAAELGLNRSEAAAYPAIYTALGTDKATGDSILGIRSGDTFRSTIQQMLPEHAGGAFEAVTAGSRAVAGLLTDPTSPYKEHGRMGYWISQVVWGSSKSIGDTASFKAGGWASTAGPRLRLRSVGSAPRSATSTARTRTRMRKTR